MIKFIEERELLRINPHVNVEIDPTFMSCLQNIFIWANEIGRKGFSVTQFYLEKGSEKPFSHPRDAQHIIKVKIFESKV